MALRDFLGAVASEFGDEWRVESSKTSSSQPEYVFCASADRKRRQKLLLEAYRRVIVTELLNAIHRIVKDGPEPWELEGIEPGEETRRYSEELRLRATILSQLPTDSIEQIYEGERPRVKIVDVKGEPGKTLWGFLEKFAMTEEGGWAPQDRAQAWVEFYSKPYALATFGLKGVPLRSLNFSIGTPGGRSSAYNVVAHSDTIADHLMKEIERLRKGEEQDAEIKRKAGGKSIEFILPTSNSLLPTSQSTKGSLLAAIADLADINLIADSYSKPFEAPPPLARNSVEQALDSVCEKESCFWKVSGNALLIRSRYWWLDDVAEPPATSVVRWDAQLAEKGVLPLQGALKIAILSADQQKRLARLVPETIPAFSGWLRFYASLSGTERSAATSSKGIGFWRIPEAKRHVILREGSEGPLAGNSAFEETIEQAAAILKVTVEANASIQDKEAGPRTFPRMISFELRPIPDVTGAVRLQGFKAQVVLPFREERKSRLTPSLSGVSPTSSGKQ